METKTTTMAEKLAKYCRDAQTCAEIKRRIHALTELLGNRQRFIEVVEADTPNKYTGELIDEAVAQCNSINSELLLLRETKNTLDKNILEFEREALTRD